MHAKRGDTVQGVFLARPFSFEALNAGALQPKSAQAKSTIQRHPGVEAFQVNLRPKSGGWPLPRDVQQKMESALGASFSDVRVHIGSEASAIGAIAFTWGSDVHFAPGQYNPHTPHGQFLLAHELAHVVQQRAGRVKNPFQNGVAVIQDQVLEAEADRLGRMAANHSVESSHNTGHRPAYAGPGQNAVTLKTAPKPHYMIRGPLRSRTGWQIQVAAQNATQPVGSVQLTAMDDGVFISNLKVEPEHRRHGVAGQLINAALRTARSNGYQVTQLESCPDSPADIAPQALLSMYRSFGFQMAGISHNGVPLLEHRG